MRRLVWLTAGPIINIVTARVPMPENCLACGLCDHVIVSVAANKCQGSIKVDLISTSLVRDGELLMTC